jgi:hypothetical protein
MTFHATAVALSVALLFAGGAARAQSGGVYDLRHNTIDGGGALGSFSGAYTLSGTIGQPDAGRSSSAAYALTGGFWAGIQESTPSPTPSFTATVTASSTSSPSPSRASTETAVPTGTASNTPNPSPIQSATRSPTPTTAPSNTPTAMASPTESPSATPSPSVNPAVVCVGDCSLDDEVTIAELLRMVNIALGGASVDTCEAGDSNHDKVVTINEILQAVSRALTGCAIGVPASALPVSVAFALD